MKGPVPSALVYVAHLVLDRGLQAIPQCSRAQGLDRPVRVQALAKALLPTVEAPPQ